MKWLLLIPVVIGVLVGIAAFVGSRVPVAHSASRQAYLAAPPETVWHVITDVERFPSWRSDVKRVTWLTDADRRTKWVEEGRSGRLTLVVEREEPPRLLVGRIADRNAPFGGSWTYEILPAAGGSTITITENGEIYNPLFRFMARFVFGYESTLKSYLEALTKKLESKKYEVRSTN